jgi:hypothetical protein
MVAVDPIASLGIRDVEVTIGGFDYFLKGKSAADWLERMTSGDMSILGWLDEKVEDEVLDRLSDDDITVKQLNDATLDVVSVAAGRPWWWAMQLVMYATSDIHHWSRINGRLILAGIDSNCISFSAWVDAVYVIYTENMKAGEEYDTFKMQIDTPPTIDLIDEEAEAEAFLSMLG